MPNPLSGAPSHPDTSPKAVARQLREASDVASYLAEKEVHEPAKLRAQGQAVRFRDLADALDAAPAWEERVERVMDERPFPEGIIRTTLAIAFPEYAPQTAPSVRQDGPRSPDPDQRVAKLTPLRAKCPQCGAEFDPWAGYPHETRSPLTKRQWQLLCFLKTYHHANGIMPTFEEIAQEMALSSLATVHEHLTNLERKGWVRRRHMESRAITLTDAMPELVP